MLSKSLMSQLGHIHSEADADTDGDGDGEFDGEEEGDSVGAVTKTSNVVGLLSGKIFPTAIDKNGGQVTEWVEANDDFWIKMKNGPELEAVTGKHNSIPSLHCLPVNHQPKPYLP